MRKFFLLAALVFLFASRGHAQSLVNTCLVDSGGSAAGSQACTFTVGAHHAIAGLARVNGTTTFNTLADTLSSSWNSGTVFTGVGATHMLFWTCDTGAGGSDTVSLNAGAAGQRFSLTLLEYSGVKTGICGDGNIGTTGTTPTNPINSGNLTTTNANDQIIGFLGLNVGGAWTPGAGFAAQTLGLAGENIFVEDQRLSATGTHAASASNATNGDWFAAILALQKDTGSAPPCSPTDPYFVQGTSGQSNYSYTFSLSFPCTNTPGDKLVFSVENIQSFGFNGDNATVTDDDGNSYTQRASDSASGGNANAAMYETTATTTHAVTVTIKVIAAANPPSPKNWRGSLAEYRNVGSFLATRNGWGTGTTCSTSTITTSANTLYVAQGAYQGATNGVTWAPAPTGYTLRAAQIGNGGGAVGDGSFASYDQFIASGTAGYTLTTTESDGTGTAFHSCELILYGPVVTTHVRHRIAMY